MKLYSKSIQRLVKGACYFETRGGYLYPYHYTKEQIEYFSDKDFWDIRARFCPGIRIELKTDATEIGLTINTIYCSEDHTTIDLYIDGVAHEIFYVRNNGKSRHTFTLPQGEKKICLYLPVDGEIGIRELSLNGSYKSVKTKYKKLLAIGDSITQGYGAVWAGATYINVLSRLGGYEVLNQGIGGYRFDQGGVSKIDTFEPDLILVSLGTNYYDDKNYDYQNETEAFFRKLRAEFGEKPVCVVTPLWRNDNTDWERFGWCIDVIRGACSKYPNIRVVNGLELVPNLDEYFIDKLHPNSYGMMHYALNLHRKMKELGL